MLEFKEAKDSPITPFLKDWELYTSPIAKSNAPVVAADFKLDFRRGFVLIKFNGQLVPTTGVIRSARQARAIIQKMIAADRFYRITVESVKSSVGYKQEAGRILRNENA